MSAKSWCEEVDGIHIDDSHVNADSKDDGLLKEQLPRADELCSKPRKVELVIEVHRSFVHLACRFRQARGTSSKQCRCICLRYYSQMNVSDYRRLRSGIEHTK